jgi:hypothetical protein
VPIRVHWVARSVVFLLLVAAMYGLVRLKRAELVDFAVPYTAATRVLNHEALYRPQDGHYQYKYLPAFAVVMTPFTVMPKPAAEFVWFELTVAMTWMLVRLALAALPDRRLSERTLIWLTLLLTGKFLVKELAFGQFNLPVALLLLGAIVAARHGRVLTAGALVAAGVFIKPYALVLVPWLALAHGWRPFVTFGIVSVGGLLLPAAVYGWDGNIGLLKEWYRTVSETTAPNLMAFENISFASMWAKWIGPGPTASILALASVFVAGAAGLLVMAWRKRAGEPNYLEGAFFCVLIPLLSPQGWDYVLVIALPAYMVLVDRWRELTPNWRAVTLTGFFLTSFTIFDLLRRPLYTHLMQYAGVTVGAILVAICLMRLRWKAAA